MRNGWAKVSASLLASLLSVGLLAGCGGDDDGTAVRSDGGASGSGSASGSGAASGSAAGGSSAAVAGAAGNREGADDPLLAEAATAYAQWVGEQIDELTTSSKAFTDAVRAGDVAAAKLAYAPSRQAWEAIEPVAGLVEDLDGALDSRVDDFSGVDDPGFTGWHRLEYQLWELGTIDERAKELADRLDADIARLAEQAPSLEITPAVIAVGAAELIEEAANGKMTGEEDRYSKTDLWDVAANVEGSERAFELLRPALEARDADLAARLDTRFSEVDGLLAAARQGDGYRPFDTLTDAELTKMKASLAALSEDLSQVAGALGLT